MLDRQGTPTSNAPQQARGSDAADGKKLPADRQADRQEPASDRRAERSAAAREDGGAEKATPGDGPRTEEPAHPESGAQPSEAVATAPPAEHAGARASEESVGTTGLSLDLVAGDGLGDGMGGAVPAHARTLADALGETGSRLRGGTEGVRSPVIAPADSARPELKSASASGDLFTAAATAADRIDTASLSEGAPVELMESLRSASATARVDGSPAPLAAPAAAVTAASPTTSTALAPATAAADGEAAAYSLEAAPDDPEFPREMTSRLSLMLREGNREARLQLHPAELGRVQVTINTDGDQARVMFVADSQAARDAIEQALPRLREALAEQGLDLAQADVGQQGPGGGDKAGDGAGDGAGDSAGEEAIVATDAGDAVSPGTDDDSLDVSTLTLRSTARLDLYA